MESEDKKEKSQILFTHVFNDTFDRVYKNFWNMSSFIESFPKRFLTKVEYENGTRQDENDTIILVEWKKYYKIKLKVCNCIKTEKFIRVEHKTINITQFINASFTITYRFYWNTCEHNTLVVINFDFDDNSVKELFKDGLTVEEMNFICNELETYLYNTKDKVIQTESIVINTSLNNVWNYVLDLENLLFYSYKNLPYKLALLDKEENKKNVLIKGNKYRIFKEKNNEEITI